jgi:Flp pilus assembly protein TadD
VAGRLPNAEDVVYYPLATMAKRTVAKPKSASTKPRSEPRFLRTAILFDRILPVALFVLVACFAIHKIVAYDVWWQLKTGEWVLTNGFPTNDPFSYATPDRPWIEMRWLYCVAINLIFKAFGLNYLILAKVVVVLAAFCCLWFVDRGAPIWARCLGITCTLALAHFRFTIRPELITFVLLSFTLLALYRYKSGGKAAWIYVLPILQIVWTNSHTLFVLGPVTIWIFALAEFFSERFRIPVLRENVISSRYRPLLTVATLSTVSCLVSPYFFRGAIFPIQLFSEIQSGNILRELITEFQSPFSYASYSIFFVRYPIVAAISAAAFVLNRRQISPGVLCLWLAYLYLSVQAERNVSLFGLVAGFSTIVNCSEAASQKSRVKVINICSWTTRTACALIALVAIPAVVTDWYYQKIDPSRRFGFGIAKQRFPIKAMTFIDAQGLSGPVLANLTDSNFVLFDRGSKSIFVDGRLEVYGGEIVKRADELFKTGNEFDETATTSGIEVAMIAYGKDGNLFRTINRKPDWAPVYFDESHVVFVRVTPENRATVESSRVDWSNPVRRDVAIDSRLDPPDWLGGIWPRVADNTAPKALGDLALLTGNLRLARQHFEDACRLRPNDSDAALHLLVICRALGDDSSAVRLQAQAGTAGGRVATAMNAAAAFESSGTLEAAVASYKEMIDRGRGNIEVYQKMLQAALGANMLDSAETACLRWTEQQPNSSQCWNSLGAIASRNGSYERAIGYFERSLAVAPRQPSTLTSIGLIYVRTGDRGRASEAFRQALQVDPAYQAAREQLALLEAN